MTKPEDVVREALDWLTKGAAVDAREAALAALDALVAENARLREALRAIRDDPVDEYAVADAALQNVEAPSREQAMGYVEGEEVYRSEDNVRPEWSRPDPNLGERKEWPGISTKI